MDLAKQELSLEMKEQQRYGKETVRGYWIIHPSDMCRQDTPKHTLVVDVHVGLCRCF